MKAIVFDEFGGPEVLHEAEIEKPEPGPGQVRVRVRAAGVNPLDGKIRAGYLEQVRPTTLPATPGVELAGTVDALGDGVSGLTVGQEVAGWSDTGAYAEYALATDVVALPAGLGSVTAVTLPVGGETAGRVLRELKLAEGETVLIHGAAGAVGSFAVQLAVALGATVIGTASPANQDYVASLGAIPTTYGEGLVERVRELAPQGIDAVFDVAGKGALPDSITLRGGTDRIITIADMAAGDLGIPFSAGSPDGGRTEVLADLVDRAARGELKTAIADSYPLAEAAAAQRVSDAGHARGKLLLTVA
jgi:NADPH:quinone reductase-like Zn-dependent oxidoreductase